MPNPEGEELTITLPITALRVLIWGDDRLDALRPFSVGPGDTAKVYPVPLVIGQLIQDVDKNEDFIHVEIQPEHAELWLSFEWKESNARHTRFREQCKMEREQRDKRNQRIAELKLCLDDRLPEHAATKIAETMLENLSKLDLINDPGDVLKALNVLETLQQYVKEDTKIIPRTEEASS